MWPSWVFAAICGRPLTINEKRIQPRFQPKMTPEWTPCRRADFFQHFSSGGVDICHLPLFYSNHLPELTFNTVRRLRPVLRELIRNKNQENCPVLDLKSQGELHVLQNSMK